MDFTILIFLNLVSLKYKFFNNIQMAYKKLHKEIEVLINLRLESILSQIDLDENNFRFE